MKRLIFLISFFWKPLGSSSNEKKNSPAHVNIQKIKTRANSARQLRQLQSAQKFLPAKYAPHRAKLGLQISWLVSTRWIHYFIKLSKNKTFFIQKPDRHLLKTILNMFEWGWKQISTTADHETIALCLVMALVSI